MVQQIFRMCPPGQPIEGQPRQPKMLGAQQKIMRPGRVFQLIRGLPQFVPLTSVQCITPRMRHQGFAQRDDAILLFL